MAPSEDRAGRALEVLRVLVGLIWAANLLFIVLPASSANYFNTNFFSSAAYSYAATSAFGPGLANYVAAHPLLFAWLIAIGSGYLAVAFLLGFTTRLACLLGMAGAFVLLLTQWNGIFVFGWGTDVGPQPLYLAIYAALFLGGAGRLWSLDARLWKTGRARLARITRWVSAPHPVVPQADSVEVP